MQISIFYHVDPLQKEDAAQVEVAETLQEEKGEDKEDNMPVPTKKFRLKRGSAKAKTNVEPEESQPETKPEAEGIPKLKETAKSRKKPVTKAEDSDLQAKSNDESDIKPKARKTSKPKTKQLNKPEVKPENEPEPKGEKKIKNLPENVPESNESVKKVETKSKKSSPMKRELSSAAAGNSRDGGPAKKIPKNNSVDAGKDAKKTGKGVVTKAATPGTPPPPKISNRDARNLLRHIDVSIIMIIR